VESLPSKTRILEKREKEKERKRKKGGKDWKAKEVKPSPHMKKFHVSKGEKKKRGWNLQAAGRDSIERKKERRSHFPIVQNLMCGLIHTHTSFTFALPSIPWLFPFLPPFTTPFSINHDYLPHKLSDFPLLLQYTRCSIGTSWEWTTTKILAERKKWLGGWVIEW
jgi:hypothetical protein